MREAERREGAAVEYAQALEYKEKKISLDLKRWTLNICLDMRIM